MLLPNRRVSFKYLILSATLLVICFVWIILIPRNEDRYYDFFLQAEKNCSPGSHFSCTTFMRSRGPVAVTKYHSISKLASYEPSFAMSTPTVAAIPQKFWYKVGAKGVRDDSKEWLNSCLEKNPTFRHEFLTDETGESFVQEHYAHRHDIVDTYQSLTVPILKADLLRYLILFAEGGVWSDLDVSCEDEIPIDHWIPEQDKNDISLVVGLEFDSPWQDDGDLHSQFASWMIMAKPGSPHLSMVIEDALQGLYSAAKEHNVTLSELKKDMVSDVVDVTGPKRMTRSIVKSLEMTLHQVVDDRNISGLTEPRILGDVLVLPGNAFAASQSGYPENQGPRLVAHHYTGSWKNEFGGELA